MTMKKILLPIDGSERSMKSIELVKNLYGPESADITLILVCESLDAMISEPELEAARAEAMPVLYRAAHQLKDYAVEKYVVFGKAGEEILNYAEKKNIDMIVMTKSTRIGWLSKIGSVTAHVVKYAKCIVIIVPEL